jgi:hypothetical protein
MLFHERRSRSFVWNAVVVLVTLSLHGCRSTTGDGIVISSYPQLKSYVHFAVGSNGHKEANLYFPLLQVYDPAGRLVYVGHDARENAKLLDQLPGNLDSLKPIPETTLLPDVMKEMPEFAARKDEVLRVKQVTVLSVFLEDCHACSIQEEALDSTEKQLVRRGVNLLIIRVAKPVGAS